MKNRHIRRLFSAVILAGLVGGCAQTEEHEWVMKVNEESVPTEVFVMSEMMAYMEAQTMSETDDVLTETIEDKTGEQWISDTTVDNVKEYYFINEEFEERGLEITEEEDEYLSKLAENQWDIVGEIYGSNGITSEYYKEYLTHLYKTELVFNDIYLTDEMISQSAEKIMEYLSQNLSRVEAFAIHKINADGTELTDKQREEIALAVNGAIEKIADGEDAQIRAMEMLNGCSELMGYDPQVDENGDYIPEIFMNISSAQYTDEFKKFVFSLDVDESGIYEKDDYLYVVHKLPLTNTDEEYDQLVKQVMYTMKNSDFLRYISEGMNKYTVTVNDQAISFYAPSKIQIKVK